VSASSISAIIYGRGVREKPFTEQDGTDETNRRDTSAYDRAKTIAERAVFDPIVRGRLHDLRKRRAVSSEKARRMLGWTPRAVTETVLDTARSLQASNLV
jgi:hypothetical protein